MFLSPFSVRYLLRTMLKKLSLDSFVGLHGLDCQLWRILSFFISKKEPLTIHNLHFVAIFWFWTISFDRDLSSSYHNIIVIFFYYFLFIFDEENPCYSGCGMILWVSSVSFKNINAFNEVGYFSLAVSISAHIFFSYKCTMWLSIA